MVCEVFSFDLLILWNAKFSASEMWNFRWMKSFAGWNSTLLEARDLIWIRKLCNCIQTKIDFASSTIQLHLNSNHVQNFSIDSTWRRSFVRNFQLSAWLDVSLFCNLLNAYAAGRDLKCFLMTSNDFYSLSSSTQTFHPLVLSFVTSFESFLQPPQMFRRNPSARMARGEV